MTSTFCSPLTALIDQKLGKGCEVVSFDLFDTLLLRFVYYPHHLFFKVGKKADELSVCSVKHFVKMRMVAEKLSRAWARLILRKEEVRFEDIYRLLGVLLHVHGNTLNLLRHEEIRIERQLTYLNPEIADYIETLKNDGRRMIFTSDMYLPFEYIFTLLKEIGIIFTRDQLYLSSSLGKRKRWGNLFRHILREENIAPNKLLHVGDSADHDCMPASALGIKTMHYERDLPRPEWLKKVSHMDFTEGILRKVADETFLESLRDTGDRPLSMMASYAGGPVLFSFMHWVMRASHKEGITRLYFLARDGQILQKIAEIINNHFKYGIELRYLYASRHSWILPSLLNFETVADKFVLFKFSKDLTLEKLLHRFKIEEMNVEWLFPKIKALGLKIDVPLNIMTIGRAKKLFSDMEILSHIRTRANKDFELVSGYLKQEGLFESTDYAVIDIGWRGSLASALRRLFIKNRRREKGVTFFFFDLLGQAEVSSTDRLLSFLATTNNRDRHGIRGEIEILTELFTAADHESTYGFEKRGAGYRPLFIKEDLSLAVKWGLKKQQQIFLRFARNLLENRCFEDIAPEDFYRVSVSNFYRFLHCPTKEIAEKVSRYPYNVQQTRQENDEYNTVCSPYRLRDFVTLVQNRNVIRPNDLWIQGSLALTNNAFVRLTFKSFYKVLAFPPMRWVEEKVKQMI